VVRLFLLFHNFCILQSSLLSVFSATNDPPFLKLKSQIRDSNRAMLLACAVQQKCKVVDLGIAEDTEESLKEHMDAALRSNADIIITSGGVSMGDRDLVKPCLAKMGKIHFEKVPFKPPGASKDLYSTG
jgi:molybdenum cofactor synthesis domain-containing protein